MFNGAPAELLRDAHSLTAKYLRGDLRVGRSRAPRAVSRGDPRLAIRDASEHNLKHVDVEIPLNRLVCVTGVSGSGKSTLVEDVLHNALLRALGKPKDAPGAHAALEGAEHIGDVVLVDQAPIGRTTREQPRELRRRARAHPQALRRRAARTRAQVHGRHFQLQLRQRPLPDVLAATASSTSRCSS